MSHIAILGETRYAAGPPELLILAQTGRVGICSHLPPSGEGQRHFPARPR